MLPELTKTCGDASYATSASCKACAAPRCSCDEERWSASLEPRIRNAICGPDIRVFCRSQVVSLEPLHAVITREKGFVVVPEEDPDDLMRSLLTRVQQAAATGSHQGGLPFELIAVEALMVTAVKHKRAQVHPPTPALYVDKYAQIQRCVGIDVDACKATGGYACKATGGLAKCAVHLIFHSLVSRLAWKRRAETMMWCEPTMTSIEREQVDECTLKAKRILRSIRKELSVTLLNRILAVKKNIDELYQAVRGAQQVSSFTHATFLSLLLRSACARALLSACCAQPHASHLLLAACSSPLSSA